MAGILERLGLVGVPVEEVLDRLAAAGWERLDEGHFASVHAHPAEPGIVLRVADCVDAFATYAVLSRGPLRPWVGEFVPVVHDMAVTPDDCLLAACESLEPVPELDEHPVAAAMARRLRLGASGRPDDGTRALLDAAVPRFEGFVQALAAASGRSHFDSRSENLMRRGGAYVFNDPFGTALLPTEIQALRARLPLPALGDVPPPPSAGRRPR